MTDIDLNFLIFFLLTVTAVTVKSVTGRQFYHLPISRIFTLTPYQHDYRN
jgi:hypothetical protein